MIAGMDLPNGPSISHRTHSQYIHMLVDAPRRSSDGHLMNMWQHLHGSMLPADPWLVLFKPRQTLDDIKIVIQIKYDDDFIVLQIF